MLMVLSSVAAVFAEGETAPQTDGTGNPDQVLDENTEDDGYELPPAVEPGTDNPKGEDGTVDPEGEDGTVDPEGEDGTVDPEGDGTVDPDADAPEAPLADPAAKGEKVKITIKCMYTGATKPFSTKTREVAVGDIVKAPVLACSTNPNPETFPVVAGQTEYEVRYKPTAPEKVTGFQLHPSYKSIILTWDNVLGADKYKIYRSKDNKNWVCYKTVDDTTSKTQKFTDVNAKGTVEPFSEARKYYYRIAAVNVSLGHNYISEKTSVHANTCVRPMYEKVTFKEGVSLTSHDGKNKTRYFDYGDTIIAQGFGGGKYKFWYKGNYFYASYVRMKNCIAMYQKNPDGFVGEAYCANGMFAKQDFAQNGKVKYSGSFKNQDKKTVSGTITYYDKLSAESFVNKSGKGSNTSYLIWVSTYQQHLYIFKGRKGHWKLIKDWECSTGAAKSPTPTGFDNQIQEKDSYYSYIRYWSKFQHDNSIHGTKNSSYRFGKPMSNGCVRNFDRNAFWIYDNCKIGTGLIVH